MEKRCLFISLCNITYQIHIFMFTLLISIIYFSEPLQGEDGFVLETISTLMVPNDGNAEIIACCQAENVLLATNSRKKSVDFYEVQSMEACGLVAYNLGTTGNSLPTIYEPTSVAVHPTLPIALVTVTGKDHNSKGRLIGLDLRKDTRGTMIISQPLGIWPDSIGISPNGKWAIVANEAEEDASTPGSIGIIELGSLDIDNAPSENKMPYNELPDLEKWLGQPIGDCEPEFVCFDPSSRFALVTCQENDQVVVIDLACEKPSIVNCIKLALGANPDGIDVLDEIEGAERKKGCLICVAEEGSVDRNQMLTGNTISIHWINPDGLDSQIALMARIDVHPWVCPDKPNKRLDPESVMFIRIGETPFLFVSIERANMVLFFDLSNPMSPRFITSGMLGERPEGLVKIVDSERKYLLSGNEGKDSTGSISFLQLKAK